MWGDRGKLGSETFEIKEEYHVLYGIQSPNWYQCIDRYKWKSQTEHVIEP